MDPKRLADAVKKYRRQIMYDDMEITIRLGIWPFRRSRTFRGSTTVWHDVETGRRPGAETEMRLSALAYQKRHQKDLDAIAARVRAEYNFPDEVKPREGTNKGTHP